MKEHWIRADEKFREQFFEENGREPTEEDVDKGMEKFFPDYLGSLADHAHDLLKEKDL